MELKEQLSGVPGMLRPFKAYLREAGLGAGDQVVYYGCPGTYTLHRALGFAVRDLPIEQIYVPYMDEAAAKVIRLVDGVGMQAAGDAPHVAPKVIVLMGGLAMPGVPVTRDEVQAAISPHKDASIVGVCFMEMFEKGGWLDTFAFDLVIDAALDPVKIWR